jgi:hypothetical protein
MNTWSVRSILVLVFAVQPFTLDYEAHQTTRMGSSAGVDASDAVLNHEREAAAGSGCAAPPSVEGLERFR